MQLRGGRLKEFLESIPDIKTAVTKAHLAAIEKRLLIVFATIEYCKSVTRNKNNSNMSNN